jgi:hypothetical protein
MLAPCVTVSSQQRALSHRRRYQSSRVSVPDRHSGVTRSAASLLLWLCVAALLALAASQDMDHDGVADASDACPGSTRASRVDRNGCSRKQIDADGDGVCNANRPRDALNHWLPTRREWCVGADNCNLVANADQAHNAASDAKRGDACNTGACACACACACVCVCVHACVPLSVCVLA